MIRVVLVDDQLLLRQGIQTLLELEPDIRVVGSAANGRDAVAAVEQSRPDVVLMDVRMPEMDGVAATEEISRRFPDTGVIILTTFDDDEYVFEGLKAGARGYLLKDVDSDEMIAAIRAVAAGDALIQPRIARKVVAEFSRLAALTQPVPTEVVHDQAREPLTDREMEVLRAMAGGLSNREIAARLGITEGTVKNHVSNVLAKLDARDRTQAILRAQAVNLVP